MSRVQGIGVGYVLDDRVVAHAADFDESKPAGFTKQEAQRHRAVGKICRSVIETYSVPMFHQSLSDYYCERIVQQLPGQVVTIPIGYEEIET